MNKLFEVYSLWCDDEFCGFFPELEFVSVIADKLRDKDRDVEIVKEYCNQEFIESATGVKFYSDGYRSV